MSLLKTILSEIRGHVFHPANTSALRASFLKNAKDIRKELEHIQSQSPPPPVMDAVKQIRSVLDAIEGKKDSAWWEDFGDAVSGGLIMLSPKMHVGSLSRQAEVAMHGIQKRKGHHK
jgi:hypothetical protein